MSTIRLVPLRWNYYKECRTLFEDLFNISEHSSFQYEWDDRYEKRSFAALYYGVVIGFVLVDKTKSIRYICVNKEFQNEKLGSKLLTRVCDCCVDERVIRLVTADNEWLMEWYKKYGFRATHIYHSPDGEFAGADMVRRQRSRSGRSHL